MGENGFAHPRMPVVPVVAAGLVLGLDGIIVEVEEVTYRPADAPLDGELAQVAEGRGNQLIVVLAEQLKREDPGGRHLGAGPPAGLVAEAAACGVVAGADIGDGLLDGILGYRYLGVVGGAQRHDLHDGDAEVMVARGGFVAPAAVGRLHGHDQVDRLAHAFLDLGIRVHAVHLGEGQGGQSMSVHTPGTHGRD